jgi:hypothetical protein
LLPDIVVVLHVSSEKQRCVSLATYCQIKTVNLMKTRASLEEFAVL